MDPRRHLVEQGTLGRGEEFEREDSDVIERVGDLPGERLGLGDLHSETLGRGVRAAQNAPVVNVARRRPADDPAVLPPAKQDREFRLEVYEGLENRGSAANRLPRVAGFRGFHDPGLALAVIAEAPGLQNRRRAERRQRFVEALAVVHRPEGRR